MTSFGVLWCYEQINSLFKSKSSSPFPCKISNLSNYQNMSYEQFEKPNFVNLLSVTSTCTYDTLQRVLTMLVKSIYKSMRLCGTSSIGFFCSFFIVIAVKGSLYKCISHNNDTDRQKYSPIFSSFFNCL